jgi:hypothetical protein
MALILLIAAPASAGRWTFQRAAGNILMAPLDLVLAPYVGTQTIVNNLQDIDDTTGVRIGWVVPGLVWNTGMQIGGALMRELVGLVELGPGLLLLPFEGEMDPLYAPPERSEALVDYETDYLWVKFGVRYTE